jgi:hypothetical protein
MATLADIAAGLLQASFLAAVPLALLFALVPFIPSTAAVAGSLVAVCVLFLVTFLIADADLGLLAQAPPGPEAFTDKTCVIVGASRGLGAGLTTALCGRGAKVIIASRNVAQLEVRALQQPILTVSTSMLPTVCTCTLASPFSPIRGCLSHVFVAQHLRRLC